MANAPQVVAQQDVKRIGILLSDLGNVDVTALKFLILQLNRLQHTFEYEFLPVPSEDPYIQSFSNQALVDPGTLDSLAFYTRYSRYLQTENQKFGLKDPPVDRLILVTTARRADNIFAWGIEADGSLILGILAYGGWKRNLAPPSILEFMLAGVLAESAYSISPSLQNSIHLATKGCLCDFTVQLSDARLHVLTGFICHDCRAALASDGLKNLADELDQIFEKSWLGKSSEPGTPAAILAKLHADLFVTTGLKLTFWEKTKSILQEQWLPQLLTFCLTVMGAILTAYLIIRFGLK